MKCHLCPARFDSDDGLACHFVRHRALSDPHTYWFGMGERHSVRATLRRQARRGAAEELRELFINTMEGP